MPREHGAYGQLAVPAVAAIAAWPTWGGLALALAATTTFLAHEPVLILLGQRGGRVRAELGAAARRRLIALGLVTAGAGLAALIASPVAVLFSLIPLTAAAALGWFVLRHEEKTLAGELLAGAAISGVCFPVAIAAGVDPSSAGEAWTAWALGFAAATGAVRLVVSAFKKSPERAAAATMLIATLVATAMWFFGASVMAAIAPLMVAAWALALVRPHPKQLRRVGWALVAATVASGGLVVALA